MTLRWEPGCACWKCKHLKTCYPGLNVFELPKSKGAKGT